MALAYRQVKDLYDTLHDAGVVSQSLPDWSTEMNRISQSDLYSAGLHDNLLKRASVGLDRFIEKTGIPQATGDFGADVGAAIGNEEAGRSIGHGAGRALVNFAPLLVPGLGEVQGANLARLGLTGLLSGAESYTASGSPTAGIIGGAANALMPGVAGRAESALASRGFGRLAQFIGGQGAAAGFGEVGKEATALVDPTQPYHFSPTEAALNLTLGQAPFFAVHGLAKVAGLGRPVDEVLRTAQKATEMLKARKLLDEQSPLDRIPDVTPPTEVDAGVLAETQTRLAKLRGEQVAVEDDATLDGPTRLAKINQLMAQEAEVLRTSQNVNELGLIPKRVPKVDPATNPPLPVQPEEWQGFKDTFASADTALEGALTNGKLASVVNEVNGTLERVGEAPVTDAMVQKKAKQLLDAGVTDDPTTAVKKATQIEVRKKGKVVDALSEQQERIRATGDPSELASGENRGTVNRQINVPVPVLDSKTEAIHDFLDETISSVQGQKDAADSFRKWQAGTKVQDVTSLPLEKERYKIFWRLRESGEIGREMELGKQDLETFNNELKSEGLNATDAGFPERDHVLNWDDSVAERVRQVQQGNAAPQPATSLPAGDKWLFSIGEYNAETNTLNGKHKLPKDGQINEGVFRNIAGVGKPLTQPEVDLYKVLVPEAFSGEKVNVPKLVEGLKKNGPVVETKELGEGARSGGTNAEMARLQHDLETALGADWERVRNSPALHEHEALTPELKAKIARYNELELQSFEDSTSDSGDARYSFLGPKPESEMPGYIEGLVRVPLRGEVVNDSGKPATSLSRSEWDKLESRQGLHYSGPHFGSEDTNVLSFYRGYEETLPDGTKAFHVIEVQSDWGQKVRDAKAGKQQMLADSIAGVNRRTDLTDKEKQEYIEDLRNARGSFDDYPLLRVYESLALKAAIAHAKEVGATKVILSDAETAMMTEGHDRGTGRFRVVNVLNGELVKQVTSRQEAENEAARYSRMTPPISYKVEEVPIAQDAGMRLHYDQTLPSAMEKLTGEKGTPTELGVHKNASNDAYGLNQQRAQEQGIQSSGSPVFRNPDGTPKSSITGRVYDISNTPNAFTLTDKARSPRDFVIIDPEDQQTVKQTGLVGTGHDIRRGLLESTTPMIRALAEDLGKFPAALDAVTSRVIDGDGSAAFDIGGRKVELRFSKGLLYATPESRDYIIAHELVHGLSLSELNNPSKAHLVDQLDELRQRLIDNLPKDMRKSYDKAAADGWYDKYVNGEVQFDSLHPGDTDKGGVIYSLLNTHEMVAQGLMDAPTRKFMQSVKTEKGGWFSRFSNIIKELVGIRQRVPDSVFEEFLSKSDALLQRGEHVADFSDFATRFLDNQGLSPGLVSAQSRRALGLVIDAHQGVGIFESLQRNNGRNLEVVQAMKSLTRLIQTKGEEFQQLSGVLDELGYDAGWRGLDDFTHEALTLNERNLDALDLMPDAAVKYVFAQAKDMKQVLDVVEAAASEKNKGLINLADPTTLRGQVADAQGKLKVLLGENDRFEQAQANVDGLYAVEPDGYVQKMVAAPAKELPVWTEDADKTKRSFGQWLKDFLQPTAQLARENPLSAELISKGHQLAANARKMASEGLKVFGLDPDSIGTPGAQLTKESVDKMAKTIKDPKLNKAVDAWIWRNQVEGRKSGETHMLPDTDPEVQKALAGLTDQQRKDVAEVVAKHQVSSQMMQAQQLEKMLQIGAANGAVVIARDTGLKARDNIQLAQTMMDATTADRSNQQAAQMADAKIATVQSKLAPETFLKLLKYSQGESEKYNLWKDFFAKNPAWSSGQRYGTYLVEYRRGKRTFLAGVESRKEAEVLAEGGQITKFEKNQKSDDDAPPVLGPDSVGVVTRLRELEENQLAMLRDHLTPDEIEQVRKASAVEQFATEESYRGGVPNLKPLPRGLTKGAEELPWLSNHFSWVTKTSNFWSRQLLRAQARAHLLDPEVAADPTLQAKLQTHVGNMLARDPALIGKLNAFTSTWFMGFNPASAMINGTQSFVTHVAELTSLTGKPLDSYRRVVKAMNEVGGTAFRKNKEWASDDHARLIKEASQDGEIDYSMFDDTAAANEAIATNYKRIMNGHNVQTLGQQLGTAAGAYTKAGMWMFKGVEKVNNQAALLAGFDYYREQGLGYDEAKAKAYEFNHAVNFGGGRAQRPIGIFSGRGTFARSAAMLSTSLQSYVLGTTFQLTRYIQRGFFRPEGITPYEVYSARKAAVQMLATQFAAAGTLGLPFVSGAIALLDKAFPELEVNRHLRQWVTDLFGGDKENGSVLSDIAMTGMPSMMGWDLQSRLSMGNTLPGVSEINGFQPEQLAGPPLNLIANFVNGGRKLLSGDVAGATQSFLPSAAKKLVGLAQTGGKIQDYRGRPILDPTAGESVGLALGFQPKRLSDFNAAQRIADQSQKVQNQRAGQERQQLAEEVTKGNFGSVRQALTAKLQSDSNYKIADEVRAIAQSAEDLTFPRDLRREGSASGGGVRSRLLSSFNLPSSSVSEEQRLQFRQQVEQRLGLPASRSSEVLTARTMDQLRTQSPESTRSELRQQAERLLRGSRLHTLLPSAE